MEAGRTPEHDLLSVKYLEAFRGKKLHKVPVLVSKELSYKQMLYLVGTEFLNLDAQHAEDEILVCHKRETFCIQIQVMT